LVVSQPDTAAAPGPEGTAADGRETGAAPGPGDQRDPAAAERADGADGRADADAGVNETGTGGTGADDAGADDAGVGDADPEGAEDPERDGMDLALLEQESEIAADYVEGLLDIGDLDGDIDMDVEGERPVVSVVGATLQELVGPEGEVLEALQELTRLAVHRQTGERSRLMLDVGGYRERKRSELSDMGERVAEEVKRTGKPKALGAMSPFERKIIHDAVAAAGLHSESEGEEPERHVVVHPAAG
jgi:spoIIIJ-associated protein